MTGLGVGLGLLFWSCRGFRASLLCWSCLSRSRGDLLEPRRKGERGERGDRKGEDGEEVAVVGVCAWRSVWRVPDPIPSPGVAVASDSASGCGAGLRPMIHTAGESRYGRPIRLDWQGPDKSGRGARAGFRTRRALARAHVQARVFGGAVSSGPCCHRFEGGELGRTSHGQMWMRLGPGRAQGRTRR